MTELTSRQILDAIRQAMEEVARKFSTVGRSSENLPLGTDDHQDPAGRPAGAAKLASGRQATR